ncbi:UNVERIFIED_CONTAM: hypothetical protein NCL1_58405 [Trichonephila clavipes]
MFLGRVWAVWLRINFRRQLTRPDSISLQSNYLVRGTTSNDGWASRAAHVMGTAIPNVLSAVAFVWSEKTHKCYLCSPLVKVLPVPGRRPMNQLAERLHFLLCGGLLDDWSVEGVLRLVFV